MSSVTRVYAELKVQNDASNPNNSYDNNSKR